MEIDPREEVLYRLSLAVEHLEAAVRRFNVEDWAGVVQASQLAAENAAKAVIAHFHVPSWTHDPSGELREILGELPAELRGHVNRLIEIVSGLAPEHGRASYGLPTERVTPGRLYDRGKAEEALRAAREAVSISKSVLSRLGYSV